MILILGTLVGKFVDKYRQRYFLYNKKSYEKVYKFENILRKNTMMMMISTTNNLIYGPASYTYIVAFIVCFYMI